MDLRNFEVIIDNLEENPHCLHGPTLIFQKNTAKTNSYYACSACRDRKNCNFYLPVSTKTEIILETSNFWKKKQKKILSSLKKLKPYKKFIEILNTRNDNDNNDTEKSKIVHLQAGYCYTCCCLFLQSESKKHQNCQVLESITLNQLYHPTSIINPITDNRNHAQYFFSEFAVRDISLLLSRLKILKILCIGVPRIHEHVSCNYKNKITSLLLDFDKNYFNFYNKNRFIWYNMFNNYIFDEKQRPILDKFLQSKKIIVLMDPPFGGRVEPLARTLNLLNETFLKVNNITSKGDLKLKILWFFPYFMEQHITNSLPNFKMFDYKVNYENHSSFTDTGSRKRKFGSPVRIFTNIPLSLLDLNGVSGYKFCKPCGFWVSNENKHCENCKACTSKNGRTYIHCTKCSKCVKPSYKHCNKCSRCCLPDHICGEFQPDPNCYHCHQPGHKKRECPTLNENKKRCLATPKLNTKKRKVNKKV